jgi:hypothetical protein
MLYLAPYPPGLVKPLLTNGTYLLEAIVFSTGLALNAPVTGHKHFRYK